MKSCLDGYLLESTNRVIYTHGSDGLSISFNGSLMYGYDGYAHVGDDADNEFTIEEVKEIGNYMITELENWMADKENELLNK